MYKCSQCGFSSPEAGSCPQCNVPLNQEEGGEQAQPQEPQQPEQPSSPEAPQTPQS